MGRVLTDKDIVPNVPFVIPNFSSYSGNRCVVGDEITAKSSSDTGTTFYVYNKATDNYKVVTYSEFKAVTISSKTALNLTIRLNGIWEVLALNHQTFELDGRYIVADTYTGSLPGQWYNQVTNGSVWTISDGDNTGTDLTSVSYGNNNYFGYFCNGSNLLEVNPDGISFNFIRTDWQKIVSLKTGYINNSTNNININLQLYLKLKYMSNTYSIVDDYGNQEMFGDFNTAMNISFNIPNKRLVINTLPQDTSLGDTTNGPLHQSFESNSFTITEDSNGALVTGNTQIPDNSLVIGSPAKVKREVTEDEIRGNLHNAEEYVKLIPKK
jgi:hypothetical protein